MDPKNINEIMKIKFEIMQAAVSLFEKNNGRLTIHDISKETDYSSAQIFEYFNTIDEIKLFYYSALVLQYEAMIDEIDDFDNYTLSEKLSNFIYASFDMMSENLSFVEATFKPLILCNPQKSDYQKQVENLIVHFIKNDNLVSGSSSYLLNDTCLKLLQYKYIRLISLWLNDESDGKETTMELTDKLTGLLQEVLYTSITDRTIDLLKFWYANNSCSKNSFINRITSTFEFH